MVIEEPREHRIPIQKLDLNRVCFIYNLTSQLQMLLLLLLSGKPDLGLT